MNYLQLKDNGRLDKEEQALADYFGEGNYTPFYTKHLLQHKITLQPGDFVAGSLQATLPALKQLGIDYSHADYPEELTKYLHRNIWKCKLGDIRRKILENDDIPPVFIKPANKLKKFTGCVVSTVSDIYDGYLVGRAGNSLDIICSDPVEWVSEYRVPVINGQIKDYCHYDGDPGIMVDKGEVESMVRDYVTAPAAYCIDVGVLGTGETALVEVNDAFSVGMYSMTPEIYGELLTTRWKELVPAVQDPQE